MANPEHLTILKRGVTVWNSWRGTNHVAGRPGWCEVDLSRAKLRSARLWEINLHEADLRGVDFRGAVLHEANLSRANLEGAKLCDADLSEANLSRANLQYADLSRAQLVGTYLCRVRLEGAILNEVILGNTTFGDADLRRVKGLSTVTHYGPSHLDISTLLKSNAELPEAFLRGAGVPDQFITFARSLIAKAIKFYSCFIGYSSQDEVLAERLVADLRGENLHCWYAAEDLKIGDRFQERIEESIRQYDKVMIILSEASVQSRWVEREANAAFERENHEHRTVLFPIRIDDAVKEAKQPWAADIRRTRHIGDFRRWKNYASYQKAFERLLRDLKASPSANKNTR